MDLTQEVIAVLKIVASIMALQRNVHLHVVRLVMEAAQTALRCLNQRRELHNTRIESIFALLITAGPNKDVPIKTRW